MSSTYGDKIKISVFGESHGNGIGVVIDGLPAGFEVDFDRVLTQMARRAPGKDKTATPRKEKDLPKVLSGMLGNKLTGAPLCAVIENTNTKSGDYGNLLDCPRPGHSDYTAFVKYNASNVAAVIFRADLLHRLFLQVLSVVRFLNQRALKLLPISAVSAMFPTASSVRRKLMTHSLKS